MNIAGANPLENAKIKPELFSPLPRARKPTYAGILRPAVGLGIGARARAKQYYATAVSYIVRVPRTLER